MIAVADGVGGWNDRGVDPALFSKELCQHVIDNYQKELREKKELYEVDVKTLLVESVKLTKPMGSSTFVMAILNEKDAMLRTLNLGDSAYILLRPDGKGGLDQIFKSTEQQYGYDFPFQCGTNCDLPYDADCTLHLVKNNDIVVMGSDGVFDNLFDKEIKSCVNEHLS
mmetsp:Transcript_44260/g.42958  ORF Transcript_44260/g.42958 Transcript_44260/m.42958 type:complete len:168 (+) Transcript_44260:206-709(+)|eukprot:CAMPEP_0170559272 /NCGR_PEP_ID=MMETSP0211-20121228/41530_1 /TAXON_ID=311385 /ORGANISM="Pseudokeronopsis sp., Strain OXSARD2" /LENGTH=167 /DNA_ID=CAMNT_0010872125 /DNA_START=124 /DNA_END=627 /DNA_ORIENTATION=-